MADLQQTENRYVMATHPETGQWHIFPASQPDAQAACEFLSKDAICQILNWSDAAEKKQACMKHSTTRTKAAEIGRTMCGPCISHLYKDLTEQEKEWDLDY